MERELDIEMLDKISVMLSTQFVFARVTCEIRNRHNFATTACYHVLRLLDVMTLKRRLCLCLNNAGGAS